MKLTINLVYKFLFKIFQVFEQYLSYTFIILVANIGGYIGLCVGASFFSIADEILAYGSKFINVKTE